MVHTERVRADAVRNRARILDAARAVVAETGAEAAMEDIARRAGVAVGTLYRHFPAKTDLVAAVVEDSVERLAAHAEGALRAVADGAPPGAELARLFGATAESHATDRVFKAAAGRLDAPAEIPVAPPGTAVRRAVDALATLLAAGARAGEVRPDVEVADLAALLAGTPGDPRRRARYVAVVVDGLLVRPVGPREIDT
jgi:AcrR family transcriptional regulator